MRETTDDRGTVPGFAKVKEKVEKARDYIHAGEVIQLVLSQKFTAELTVPELDLYRALR